METGGVGSQWTKRLVLESALPSHLHDDLDDLFDVPKTDCGLIYHECKEQLLELHGPSEDRDLDIALNMVMTSDMAPSQAAKRLVQLICKEKKPLVNCCCARLVSSRWRKMLPPSIRAQVANLSLKTDYATTVKVADNVWKSLQVESHPVAAVEAVDEQVAAVRGAPAGRARGQQRRQRRGGQRGGRGGAQHQGADQGPPAPEGACSMHKRWKKKAYYCLDPSKCPWKDFTAPRPESNNQSQ